LGPFLEAGDHVTVRPDKMLANFDEPEDAQESAGISQPCMPSKEEVTTHERTHLPFRNWCQHCVRGRARDDPHIKQDPDRERGVVKLSVDYMFMHEKESAGGRPAAVQGEGLPIVILKGSPNKEIFSFAVPNKGDSEYAVRRLSQDIGKILGYKKFIFKGDQEPALRVLMDRVAALVGDQVIQEASPVGDSQANGDVENPVQLVRGIYKTLKSDLETEYAQIIPADHPALVWLVRHSGLNIFRFHKGADGMTAYRRIKGKDFNRKIVKFGENIMWLRPKSITKRKSEYKWEEGIWLGIREESGEHNWNRRRSSKNQDD
jgi:hypothetical protein